MTPKRKLIIISALSLVASITAMTSFSIAWFHQNLIIDNTLTLTSGESVAEIQGFLYHQNASGAEIQDLLGYYKNEGDYLNVVREPDAEDVGAFQITFNEALSLDLLATYGDEHYLNELAFPRFFVELRIIKENFDAYAKMTVAFDSIPADDPAKINFSPLYPFNYRILTASNNSTNLYESALPGFLDELALIEPLPFFSDSNDRTNGIPVFTMADLDGAPVDPLTPGLAPQLYVLGFPYLSEGDEVLFAKSILFEFQLDILRFLAYIREADDVDSKPIEAGITFKIDIEYSNEPVLEN